MKKLFCLISLFFSGSLYAADLMYTKGGQPESFYDVTHSTVAISSQTVATDSAVNGYRAIYIYNLSDTTTIYYTLSASTQNVTTTGWPIFPWRSKTNYIPNPEKIEYNGIVNYRLAPGAVGTMDITKKIIRK